MKLDLKKIVGDGATFIWLIVVAVTGFCGSGVLLWQWRVVVAVAGCCGSGVLL